MRSHPITDISAHNRPVLSVGELSLALKRHIEQNFDVVRVRGEITGFKGAKSGHLYFCLSDKDAVLDAICWRPAAVRLSVLPEDGLEVIISGRLTTYPGRSKYQIVVEAMELAGQGALLKLLEDRKRKLAAAGLFDQAAKRKLPYLPEVIGVVTSPTGAVIRDILHRLDDRFPRRVLLWPVLVQGAGAAEQIAAAIDGFNVLPEVGRIPRPDLLIVARGGGSLEDLWAFNEEIVVRAVAASRIPLISAVGHETDTTLIDFAADVRAPTPTAAAEIAVPVRLELAARIDGLQARFGQQITRAIADRRRSLEGAARGLPKLPRLLDDARQRLDDWSERQEKALGVGIERRRQRLAEVAGRLLSPSHRIDHARAELLGESRALKTAVCACLRVREAALAHAAALLESYSYQRVLERGFALILDRDDRAVASAAQLRPTMPITLRLHDGEVAATVDGPPVARRTRVGEVERKGARIARSAENTQGRLF